MPGVPLWSWTWTCPHQVWVSLLNLEGKKKKQNQMSRITRNSGFICKGCCNEIPKKALPCSGPSPRIVFVIVQKRIIIIVFSKHRWNLSSGFQALDQRGRKYHPSHFLFATVVKVWCMSLSRVWHSAIFSAIVGTLGMTLGLLDPGAVSPFGLWHTLTCSLSKFFSSHLLLILSGRDTSFLEENVLEHLKVL